MLQPISGAGSPPEPRHRFNVFARLRCKRGDILFPVAISACILAWFQSFPLVPRFNWLDIAFDSIVLATSGIALIYVRAFRYPTLGPPGSF
jgi:hypothetical protein